MLFFFPVSALILSQVTFNFKFFEKIILFMFLIILFTFLFQLLNLELYINLFLNNVELNKIEILLAKKLIILI